MPRAVIGLAAMVVVTLGLHAVPARSAPLVADVSKHLLEITTGFTGTELLLFGAVDEDDGGDVVVVVRGPLEAVTVRRKDRRFGIWMNTDSLVFPTVPSFYAVRTSAPLHTITTAGVRKRNEIGVTNLDLEPVETDLPGPEITAWQQGLIRGKQRRGQYTRQPGPVRFVGGGLFRTKLFFPATVPTGHYQIEVYLVRGKQVVTAQTTPLIVSKAGMEAKLFQFAHSNSAAYGIVAVLLAAVAGWLASVIFRRE